MGVSGANKATLYDDATDVYVEVELISQDSNFLKEDIAEEDLDGNMVVLEQRARLEIVFFDETDMDMLRSWASNHTKVKAVVEGLEDYIFWDRESTIRLVEPATFEARRRNVRRVMMSARGVDMGIERSRGLQLVDEAGNKILGFIGANAGDDGVTAYALPPASIGSSGTFTWAIDGTDYVMDTVTLQTLN